ncbi:MAG: hypothetical protein ABI367_10270 [Mucilaginibacter sp.]
MTVQTKYQAKLLLLLTSLLITVASNAQKLPNLQTTSLRVPANVKIDGKASEWNDQLQAYNKSTNIYYTIANDDKNLYLIIKATDKVIMKKILNNTFSFVINNGAGNKKNTSISLPIFAKSDKNILLSVLNSQSAFGTDSLISVMNLALEKVKEFDISGFEGLADENISVYNEYGIKAKAQFDNSKALTYELAIPLKYIKTTSNKLNYTIRIYGLGANEKGTVITTTPGGGVIIMNESTGSMTVMRSSPQTLIATATTDLTGDYELAK